jgi:hypothetical protein
MMTVTLKMILTSILILSVFYYITLPKKEAFGTSPGTLVQLASTHVPTAEDYEQEDIERQLVERDVKSMTGSYV